MLYLNNDLSLQTRYVQFDHTELATSSPEKIMARIKRCGLRFAYAVRHGQTAVVLRAIRGVTFCVPTPESDAIA